MYLNSNVSLPHFSFTMAQTVYVVAMANQMHLNTDCRLGLVDICSTAEKALDRAKESATANERSYYVIAHEVDSDFWETIHVVLKNGREQEQDGRALF
jgi:hypothetical protein